MLLLAVCVLLGGCAGGSKVGNGGSNSVGGKAGNGASNSGAGAGSADEGRTSLVLAIGGEPDSGFDPTLGWGSYGSPLFQSTLLKRDGNLELVHDLATSVQVSEDRLRWEVAVREDAWFTNGEQLTAKDVKFTFDTARESGSTVDLSNIAQVEVAGAFRVVFQLRQPQSTFLSALASIGIVPAHAYDASYGQRPIGSGPYIFVQWDKGQQLIVKRNSEYYGERPYFEQIAFLFLNEDAAFAAAKAGQVDMAAIPSAYGKQEVKGMERRAVKSVDNRGIMFPFVASGQASENGRLIGNDVTSQVEVRRAVNVAIDRAALVEGILEGYGTAAYSSVDGLPWWNSATAFCDGDAAEARRILAEGGWADTDGDGIVEKDGLSAEFSLLYPAGDSTRQSLALAAAAMVEQAGVRMVPESASWNEIERRMHSDAVLFGWGSHDPMELAALYSSEQRGVGYFNPGYYSNEAVDGYISQALLAATEQEAVAYWQQAQWDGSGGTSMQGDAPWAWLVNLDHLYLVRSGLDIGEPSVQPHGHGWPITANIAEWGWTK